jgi:sugar/nucleoside kinase (ribokinase family)
MAVRFVAIGEIMLDVGVASVEPGSTVHAPIRVRAGGSPATAALWAAGEGAAAAVVGRVGADAAGSAVRDALRAAGVEPRLAVDTELPTGTFLETRVGGERSIVADRGANARLDGTDVGEIEAEAVLVSGYVLLADGTADAGREALARARSTWVAVDAASRHLVAAVGADETLARAAAANALLANEEEALALTGATAEAAVEALADRFRLVCVKLGPAGAVAALDGVTERRSPPRRSAGSSAGAGDAFAGVLLASLALGRPLGASLARACAAGARAAAGEAAPLRVV